MQRLLDQLNSRDPVTRDDALRHARALPPDELLRLVVLERQIRRVRRRQGTYIYAAICGAAIPMAYCVPKGGPLGVAQAITVFVASMLQAMYRDKYNQARTQLIVLLKAVGDIRFIPHLLRAAKETWEQGLCETLERLLPQVRADHAPLWSKEDKSTLLLPLKNAKSHPKLAVCCLKALEQIGDKSATPAVKRMQEQTFAFHRDTLSQAAAECLLYLESNSGKFQQGEMLLRSSDAAHVRPDILLRPASSVADNSTGEQLLRPGNSEPAP